MQNPIYQHSTRLIALEAEAFFLQHLRNPLVLGVILSIQTCIILEIFGSDSIRLNRREPFATSIHIDPLMAVTRHAVRDVIIEVLSLFIRAEKITDGPAGFDDLSAPPVLDGIRRKTNSPVGESLIEIVLNFIHTGISAIRPALFKGNTVILS